MIRRGVPVAWLGLLLPALAGAGSPQDSSGERERLAAFEPRVRSLLCDRCSSCHSRTAGKLKGGLSLDTPSDILRGGDSGRAIVPGDPDASLLVRAIRYKDEDLRMPPKGALSANDVSEVEQWVRTVAPEAGRPASEPPWSFRPVGSPAPPDVRLREWPRNEVDRFVLSALEARGLRPAADAERRTLIRRATLDLLGLPPAPEEVEGFVTDPAPDAFAALVDRLLASPRYGERWGRHWLDVVRYADTAGFEADHLYVNAWRYRDYVLRSFNADKGFDRFVCEQVAGDELWPGDEEASVATGAYCIGPALEESAMVSGQLEYEWLTDAVDTTGAAFLGLSLGCARCHDHKYDPIPQKEYFALQAVFAASDRPFPAKIRLQAIKSINGLLAEAPVPQELLKDPRCLVVAEGAPGLRLLHRAEPLSVRRLHRGELNKPREAVPPGVPAALAPSASGGVRPFDRVRPGERRAALARWLTSPENPLTPRVIANRVWGWHFGQGLVRTPNDFGRQGESPTHPELLDWLARDLVSHGWSLKHLHRRIMLSRAYQVDVVGREGGLGVDPQNRLLWHFPRRRLEGEALRDSILACAGTLNPKEGGPPVVPALSAEELTGLFQAREKWPVTKDASEHARRSVYLLTRRTFAFPFFSSFDPPEVMTSCAQRARTAVPAQALTLLNSPLVREQASAFARRLLREGPPEPDALAARAWRIALGRDPRPEELGLVRSSLGRASADAVETALQNVCLALFNSNEFVSLE